MTRELEDWILQHYNNREGKKTSGGNQVVTNILWIKAWDDEIKDFLGTESSRTEYGRFVYIDNECYRIIVASDGARGFRSYKAVIDRRISDDLMQTIVLPSMDLYCKYAEIF